MTFAEALSASRDALLRWMPHAAPTGLIRIGDPGPDAPVLVTGNFTLTIRRLRGVLRGYDAWLLVANSGGINVWCAAGGGHLTHHHVISAVKTSGLADRVRHRVLILPQLAATGIERRTLESALGWEARWGPARLEDLPAFLERHQHLRRTMRRMTFPLWERLEMAVAWSFPMVVVAGPVLGFLGGWRLAILTSLTVTAQVFGMFAALPRLRIHGATGAAVFAGFALAGWGMAAAGLTVLGGLSAWPVGLAGAATFLSMAVLRVDLAGTTPWYPSSINSFHNEYHVELVPERCTGAAECVQVCPRDVLRMDGRRRQVEIARPDACIRCGACIVQCPQDALRFRFEDGRAVEPAQVRSTRLNMLGRRTVAVEPADVES